ncbi:hypothetical protein HD601_001419 [Jiangella mangrovi]|uniref:Uncharacterized protein n=1 Tax=Jiangella mangrovi TaxID=1524084 RepID=A0A7W9GMZ2_9ACTN|nr:hypothetical protein [Jiangella mangrovi]MBB5786844.1 hypothetical protein [Jiangella mangrovi]
MTGVQRGPGQPGEQVETQVVQGAFVPTVTGVAGGGVAGHPQGGDVLGRPAQGQRGHTVLPARGGRFGPPDPPLRGRRVAAFLGTGGVGGDHLTAQRLVQHPPGPRPRDRQHDLLHRAAHRRVAQAAGPLGDQAGLVQVDPSGFQRGEGVREVLDQFDRERHLRGRAPRRPGQRQRHLVPGRLHRLVRMPRAELACATRAVFRAGGQLSEHPQQGRVVTGTLTLPRQRDDDQLMRRQPRQIDRGQCRRQFRPWRQHRQPIHQIRHRTSFPSTMGKRSWVRARATHIGPTMGWDGRPHPPNGARPWTGRDTWRDALFDAREPTTDRSRERLKQLPLPYRTRVRLANAHQQ